MKKILFILLCVSLFTVISCTAKKDRLVADTLSVAIDPRAVVLYANETKTLTAIVKDAKSNYLNVVADWTIDPASLGTLSSARGKTITFTPSSPGAAGKIYATYSSITSIADVTIKNNGRGTLVYALLADTQAAADLTRDANDNVIINYFDTDSASPWQISTADSSPGCQADPVKCIKLDYSYGNGVGNGGFYLKYNTAQNISSYANLTFYIKGSVGGEKLYVGISDGTDVKLKVSDYIAGGVAVSWQKITIPLSSFTGLNKSAVTKPFIIAFEDIYTGSNVTVYLDCIGFE